MIQNQKKKSWPIECKMNATKEILFQDCCSPIFLFCCLAILLAFQNVIRQHCDWESFLKLFWQSICSYLIVLTFLL